MLARILSATLAGIQSRPVDVEGDVIVFGSVREVLRRRDRKLDLR